MENIKMTVKALAAVHKMTLGELAEACEINANHLKNVSAGRTKLTADDVVKLAEFTGVPPANITE